MAHHLRLDFDLVEFLAAVDTNDAADHLGHNNHVSEMCLDQIGLLVRPGVLLGLAQFLDQTHWAALEASVESTAGAGMEDGEEFVGGDIEESVLDLLLGLPTSARSTPLVQRKVIYLSTY